MLVAVLTLALGSCGTEVPTSNGAPAVPPSLRVYASPYAEVRWAHAVRLKAQHHDHMEPLSVTVPAYDSAGYQVVSIMNYSGLPQFQYGWKERRWPAERWVSTSTLSQLKNVRLFIPNGEEVGFLHLTSPFLSKYLVKQGADGATPEDVPCQSTQDCISTIARLGGLPFLAHPWNDWRDYAGLKDIHAVEIYSPVATYRLREGKDPFFREDKNTVLVLAWDRFLSTNQRIFGVAVNDHFGPWNHAADIGDDIRDSGKLLVFVDRVTLDSYRTAIERGSFFAVRDNGTVKDRYPVVDSLVVDDSVVTVHTGAAVRWVGNGRVVAVTSVVRLRTLPPGITYLRAEVLGNDGSIVYLQPLVIRPVGDSNGDGRVDNSDVITCSAVADGLDRVPEHVRACLAAGVIVTPVPS